MSWRLVLTRAASRDLAALEDYLSKEVSQKTVRRQLDRIFVQLDVIAENPLIYAERDMLGDGRRIALVQPYVVIFSCRDDEIRVLRVVHGARDLPSLFGKS